MISYSTQQGSSGQTQKDLGHSSEHQSPTMAHTNLQSSVDRMLSSVHR